jgi:hypothetical protein
MFHNRYYYTLFELFVNRNGIPTPPSTTHRTDTTGTRFVGSGGQTELSIINALPIASPTKRSSRATS